ncbi:MAG: hypothetical protein OCC45_11920 [Desulfotalea sp.]
MRKDIDELKLLLPFKETTDIGDIILIAAKPDNQLMLQYAIVTGIEIDPNKRDEWWIISFTMLSIPLQDGSLILRTEQMTGQEIFTVGGEERYVSAVDVAKPEPLTSLESLPSGQQGNKKVVKKKTPKPNNQLRRIK